MPTRFSELLRSAEQDGGVARLDVPEDWMQGRSVFGGLQLAVVLAAMRGLVPEAPLRTLQCTFVAPVPAGPLTATARILRQGKNATHVEAKVGEGLALVTAVFGTARASAVAVAPAPAAPQPIAPPFERRGFMPAFAQHFRARWLSGAPPFSGDPQTRHVIEVGMHDEGPATEAHAVALADFVPPVALSHLTTPAYGSSLTWMLELLTERFAALPLDGWRVEVELVAARDGYTSQSVLLFAPDGHPVAISRQSMLIFG